MSPKRFAMNIAFPIMGAVINFFVRWQFHPNASPSLAFLSVLSNFSKLNLRQNPSVSGKLFFGRIDFSDFCITNGKQSKKSEKGHSMRKPRVGHLLVKFLTDWAFA
jgi:hypothetical protein